MFDQLVADTAGTHGAGAVGAWTRVENAACARRLAAMVTMLDACHAADGSVDREQWCLDNWGAVCAQIGAAQQLTSGAASRLLLVAVALRDRLPHVGALFTSGTIGYRLVATIARRSGLVRDPAALRAVDAALADAVRQWGPMSVDKTEQAIDTLIAEFDPYALPRTQDRARGRCVEVFIDDASGLANLWGTLFATDGKARTGRVGAEHVDGIQRHDWDQQPEGGEIGQLGQGQREECRREEWHLGSWLRGARRRCHAPF